MGSTSHAQNIFVYACSSTASGSIVNATTFGVDFKARSGRDVSIMFVICDWASFRKQTLASEGKYTTFLALLVVVRGRGGVGFGLEFEGGAWGGRHVGAGRDRPPGRRDLSCVACTSLADVPNLDQRSFLSTTTIKATALCAYPAFRILQSVIADTNDMYPVLSV